MDRSVNINERNMERLKNYVIDNLWDIVDDPYDFLDDSIPVANTVQEWFSMCEDVGIDFLNYIKNTFTEDEYERMKIICENKEKTLEQISDLLDSMNL